MLCVITAIIVWYSESMRLQGIREAQSRVREQKPIEISTIQLFREYEENENRADDNYKGQVLQVMGEVNYVTPTAVAIMAGHIEWRAYRTRERVSIICAMDAGGVKALANLSEGMKVTIKGIWEGKKKGHSGLCLSMCVIVGDIQTTKGE